MLFREMEINKKEENMDWNTGYMKYGVYGLIILKFRYLGVTKGGFHCQINI